MVSYTIGAKSWWGVQCRNSCSLTSEGSRYTTFEPPSATYCATRGVCAAGPPTPLSGGSWRGGPNTVPRLQPARLCCRIALPRGLWSPVSDAVARAYRRHHTNLPGHYAARSVAERLPRNPGAREVHPVVAVPPPPPRLDDGLQRRQVSPDNPGNRVSPRLGPLGPPLEGDHDEVCGRGLCSKLQCHPPIRFHDRASWGPEGMPSNSPDGYPSPQDHNGLPAGTGARLLWPHHHRWAQAIGRPHSRFHPHPAFVAKGPQ